MLPTKIGRYEISSELGRGGMATVYLALDPAFDRQVAIKVLPRHALEDVQFRTRFEREAKFIAAVEHAAIVPVYDFGEQDGQPYLVMRYMRGGSLRERLERGPLSLAESAVILQRITLALEHAHRRGIIHRDLKPGNILFDETGEAYLTDFGIAKRVMSTMTLTGNLILGTPAYMSPEQARGEANIDSRTDIYALGAILFEMLTGRVPYEADTPTGQMLRHIADPVPNILEVRKDLPADSQIVIELAMAKRADARYASATELSLAVQGLIHPKGPAPAEPPTTPAMEKPVPQKTDQTPDASLGKAVGWVRGRLWLFAIPLAAVFLIVLCFGAGSVFSTVLKSALARANLGAAATPSLTLTERPASPTPAGPEVMGSVEFVGTQGGDLFVGLDEAKPTPVSPGEAVPAGPETRLWTRQGNPRLTLGNREVAILGENTAIWVDSVSGRDSAAEKTALQIEKGRLLVDALAIRVRAYQENYQVEGKNAVFGVEYEPRGSRFLVVCLSGTCVVGKQDEPETVNLSAGQRGGFIDGTRIALEAAPDDQWREMAGGEIDWPALATATSPSLLETNTPTPSQTFTSTSTSVQGTLSPTPTLSSTPTQKIPLPSDTPRPTRPRPTATSQPPPTKPAPSPTRPPPPTKQASPTLPPP